MKCNGVPDLIHSFRLECMLEFSINDMTHYVPGAGDSLVQDHSISSNWTMICHLIGTRMFLPGTHAFVTMTSRLKRHDVICCLISARNLIILYRPPSDR